MKRAEIIRLSLALASLAIVLIGAVKVLLPFVNPILWALVLGSATWPMFRWFDQNFGGRTNIAAVVTTLVVTLVVLLPFVVIGLLLASEIPAALERVRDWLEAEGSGLPDWAARIPAVEELVLKFKQGLTTEEGRRELLLRGAGPVERLYAIGKNVLRNLLDATITIFTLFFVYRDGASLEREVRALMERIGVGRGAQILQAVRETVRAVFFGWLLTAAAQGLVAMLGYKLAGLPSPVLLGIATGFAAVIPFGVSLVWIPSIAILVGDGRWGAALFLGIWSLAVVGLIDNVLRPLFISGPSKIPFILVFFGVLGGLVTFGLLGLVLGPVFLAILLALWRQGREAMVEAANRAPLDAPG
jgi:predicted PurR-regulated permease PerM